MIFCTNISSDQGANFVTANAQQHTCDYDPVATRTLHHKIDNLKKQWDCPWTVQLKHQFSTESLQDLGATLQCVGYFLNQ